MKICQRCGKELWDDATFCTGCGSTLPTAETHDTNVDDSVSVGLVILSVIFPIFGLIYWPVKAKTRPKCAKTCGIAALISWGIAFLINLL